MTISGNHLQAAIQLVAKEDKKIKDLMRKINVHICVSLTEEEACYIGIVHSIKYKTLDFTFQGETFVPPPPKCTEPPEKRKKIGPGWPRKDNGEARQLSVPAVAEITIEKYDAELHKSNTGAVDNTGVPKTASETEPNDAVPELAVDKLDYSKDLRDMNQFPGTTKSRVRGKYKKWEINDKIIIVEEAKLCGIRPIAAKYHLRPSTLSSWMKLEFSTNIQRTKKGSTPGAGRHLTYSYEKEQEILSWLLCMRDHHVPVTIEM